MKWLIRKLMLGTGEMYLLMMIAASSYAYVPRSPKGPQSLGSLADDFMEPVIVFSSFLNATCFLLGGSFLFASIVKYIEHRRSPLMVHISTVIFLFIAGLALVFLPLLPLLTGDVFAGKK